jgi:tetratricopeptide (TPR) repeat protein
MKSEKGGTVMKNKTVKQSIILISALFVFLASGCNIISPGVGGLQMGDDASKRGDSAKAIECYNTVINDAESRLAKRDDMKDHKDNAMIGAEAYYKAGLAYKKLGDTDKARAMFEKAARKSLVVTEADFKDKRVEIKITSTFADLARKELASSESTVATRQETSVVNAASVSSEQKLDMPIGSSNSRVDSLIFQR